MTRRHYTDVVLIAVVALCTLENDVIHAGYLALALLFFRRRDELRLQRNRCNNVGFAVVRRSVSHLENMTGLRQPIGVRMLL